MTGWDVLTVLIISFAVFGGVCALAYAAWSIFTNQEFLKCFHDLLKGERHE